MASYRPDIDGLRAVAVFMVVGYHIGVPGMTGGFAGVDVFFVISGYLITALLVREQATSGRIDLAAFFARRARRLLPALGVVTVAALWLGALVLLPDEQIALARSAEASLAFVANFYFWIRGQGYFADPSALVPLRHLWTLAVEEQFYLLWPVAFWGLAVAATRTNVRVAKLLVVALAATSALSLGLSIALSHRAPLAAFLLLPTRAWELGAGALLTRAPQPSARHAPMLALLGWVAIVWTTVAFDAATPFPSFYALLPVLGAVALIAAGGAAPASVFSRALAWRPLVGIGTVSYGWYLWHWPLLAFARNVWGTEPARLRDAALAAIALLLAAAMWRWVEQPIRTRRITLFRTTRSALAGGAAILVAGGILSEGLAAFARRPQPPGSILAQYRAARGGAIRDFPFCDSDRHGRPCDLGTESAARTILLWGDSHAAQLSEGLDRAARDAGVRIVVRTTGGCTPAGFPVTRSTSNDPLRTRCAAFNDGVISALPAMQRAEGLQGVVIAAEWRDTWTGWDDRLDARIHEIQHSGLRVVVAEDVPVLPADFIPCAVRRGAEACALARAGVERQAAAIDAALGRIAAGSTNVRIWSPLDALCPNEQCPAVLAGRLLYRNRNHLTIDGSALLAPTMAPMLAWLAGTPAKR